MKKQTHLPYPFVCYTGAAGGVADMFGGMQGMMPGMMPGMMLPGAMPNTVPGVMDGTFTGTHPGAMPMGVPGVNMVSGMAGVPGSSGTPSATDAMALALPGMMGLPVPGRSDLVMVPGGKVITVAKQKYEMEKATMNARRLYVGNVPSMSTKEELMDFLNGRNIH